MRPFKGSGIVAIHSHPPIATKGEFGSLEAIPWQFHAMYFQLQLMDAMYLQLCFHNGFDDHAGCTFQMYDLAV